ncbi:MAG: hypothetical protein AAFZ80_06070 [Cyanobacteria bacterium P01_A01_bin.105]
MPSQDLQASGGEVLYEEAASQQPERFDIQEALNQIEEIVLDSPRLPLVGRTLVNEDELLDQLDNVRLNLPPAFQQSVQLLKQRDDILTEAEQYAQDIVSTAEKQAAAILNDMTIIRQAEQQAQQLRQQTEQECAALREQTLDEVEQLQQQARQEWEDMRGRAIAECETIQRDADAYAEQVLQRMEAQFSEMLSVLSNGRQQLTDRRAAIDAEASTARPSIAGQPPQNSIAQAGTPVDPRTVGTQHRPIQPMQPPRGPQDRGQDRPPRRSRRDVR